MAKMLGRLADELHDFGYVRYEAAIQLYRQEIKAKEKQQWRREVEEEKNGGDD